MIPVAPARPLLEARGLEQRFHRRVSLLDRMLGRKSRILTALAGVDLVLEPGEALGVVGESGCGKSTLGRCLVGAQVPAAGEVRYAGRKLQQHPDAARLQMVFQDPYASLNPRMRIGALLEEVLHVHRPELSSAAQRQQEVGLLLESVGLSSDFARRLPHELSGGQRQRVSIARALGVSPQVIVADEPVSALDVSVQAQIINLLDDLRRERGLALVFISHDLGVVRHLCDRVAVMYLGQIVEEQRAESLFAGPRHPYTQALVSAVPNPDPRQRAPVAALEGEVPDPYAQFEGCRFAGRCPFAQNRCREEPPALRRLRDQAVVRCHRAEELLEPARP